MFLTVQVTVRCLIRLKLKMFLIVIVCCFNRLKTKMFFDSRCEFDCYLKVLGSGALVCLFLKFYLAHNFHLE